MANRTKAGDDVTAAEQLQATQDLLDKSPNPAPAALGGVIHRHRLRVAQANHDQAAAKKEIDALLSQPEADPDAAIDLVNYLRQNWQEDQAAAQFDRAYRAQKARLSADPLNPQEMNNLAWLCARCREHPAEAIDLARRATLLSPENAGYWDTLAEAQCASGNYVEAARLEARALALKPDDPFMMRQIDRFKRGGEK